MPHNSFHSETDLLQRARSGDHEAFEQLARRYSSRILATSRRILRTPADAEDNVQNVLVKAYTNLAPVSGSRFAFNLVDPNYNQRSFDEVALLGGGEASRGVRDGVR